jgi:thioredoxin 1
MPRFDTPIITNDHSIDRVLNAGYPVALVFWDGGTLDSTLDEALRQVARTDAGRVLVSKVDTRENPQTAAQVNGPLPALITFHNGQEVTRASGITAKTFRAHVDHLLGRGPRPADEPAPVRAAPRKTNGHAHAASQPFAVSDATFQRDVLESDVPVLVDLWAPWCGPCHMIAPVVDKIAHDYAGRLKVAKLNVDDNPHTAGAYHVQGIPTLLIFKNGRVADRIVGAAPEPLLRGKVDAALRK